jgi:hypothetical protein
MSHESEPDVIEDFVARSWDQLVDRAGGWLSPRFLLQPTVSAILAVRAGLQDAASDRPPYLGTMFHDPVVRRRLVHAGVRDLRRLFLIALLLDVTYQLVVFHWIYPLQSVIVASSLAVVPYLLIRGPVNRLARRAHRRNAEVAHR